MIFHKNFFLKKNFRKDINTKFLVYQPGKVGSLSIHKTLKSFGYLSQHTHTHKKANEFLKQTQSKIVIVTGFREPISRYISAFFHIMMNDNQKDHFFYVGKKEVVMNYKIGRLIDIFNERIRNLPPIVLNWGSKYMKETKLDNLFIPNKGYNFFNYNNYGFCMYKFEYFGEFEEHFFSTYKNLFQNIEKNEFLKENVSDHKFYNKKYLNFKEEYTIKKDEYFDNFLKIDWVRQLYSKEELLKIAKQYIKN